MYQGLKGIRKGYDPNTSMCKSKDGDLLVDPEEVLNRWAEYLSELLNKAPADQQFELIEDGMEVGEPTRTEVENAITSLRNHRAASEDGLAAELFKYGGDGLIEEMHALLSSIWQRETMSAEWNTAVIVPLHKKGTSLFVPTIEVFHY